MWCVISYVLICFVNVLICFVNSKKGEKSRILRVILVLAQFDIFATSDTTEIQFLGF